MLSFTRRRRIILIRRSVAEDRRQQRESYPQRKAALIARLKSGSFWWDAFFTWILPVGLAVLMIGLVGFVEGVKWSAVMIDAQYNCELKHYAH